MSVYTNYLREIRYIPDVAVGPYSGPAFKVGAGVEVSTLYEEADKLGLSVVGGIGRVGRHFPSFPGACMREVNV